MGLDQVMWRLASRLVLVQLGLRRKLLLLYLRLLTLLSLIRLDLSTLSRKSAL